MNNAKKHIGFVINALTYGGAERVFVDDANSLSAAGNRVTFCILYGGKEKSPLARELGQEVHVAYLGARSPYDFAAVRRCRGILRRSGVHILVSTLNDGNIFARWVVMGADVRLFQREANTLNAKTLLQKILDLLLGWIPFRYLAVSYEVRNSLARLIFYARTRIIFFPNAVVIPEEVPLAPRSVPRLIAVGRLTAQKDQATLIRALDLLKRRDVPFHATLIGEGVLRNRLEAQIRVEKLDGDITLTGQVSHERVREEYRNSDIFVSSSRWEGSPNVLLEAMSYGLPCVSTAVGGTLDIVTDGENGILVESGNPKALAGALEKLLDNTELRTKLGRAARARIKETFSQEARLKRLQALMSAA